jgi:Na+:H+ antiporter
VELLREIEQRVSEGANASNLAFLILLLSLIAAPMVARLVRLPPIAGLVLAGVAIGPHGFGVLASDQIALHALGDFGLLYAMFVAGLELDLAELARHRHAAITFAVVSFAIPFALGITGARLLGYAGAAATLMGASWGSHTLVAYPLLRQLGLARNRAVATVVGATSATTIFTVCVLAHVSATTRRGPSFAARDLELVLGLVVLTVWSLYGLPHLGRWFFARVGSNTGQRFVFALGAFLFGAIVAEVTGLDGIVGAFFAGLGLGRAIPARSPLMDRVVFVGGAVFVPIFLVSVGTVVDPAAFVHARTLYSVLVFTAIVFAGKTIAAVIVGRRAWFSTDEIGIMAGLSSAQVSTTLATVAVGARLGLFDHVTVGVVLAVVLVTLVVTPAITTAFGRALSASAIAREVAPLGRTILVPIWSEASRPLLGVAGRLAEHDAGMVVAAIFADETADLAELARQRELRTEAEDWLAREGLEGRSVFRISRSASGALVQTIRGQAATMVVTAWRSEIRDALTRAPVPVVSVHGAVEPFERIVIVVSGPLERAWRHLELAREVTTRLADGRPVRVVAPPWGDAILRLFADEPDAEQISTPDPPAWIETNARPRDLVVAPGIDELDALQSRVPDRFVVTASP